MDFTGDIARVEPQDELVRPRCEARRRNARVIHVVADDRDAVRRIRPGADRADHSTAGRVPCQAKSTDDGPAVELRIGRHDGRRQIPGGRAAEDAWRYAQVHDAVAVGVPEQLAGGIGRGVDAEGSARRRCGWYPRIDRQGYQCARARPCDVDGGLPDACPEYVRRARAWGVEIDVLQLAETPVAVRAPSIAEHVSIGSRASSGRVGNDDV